MKYTKNTKYNLEYNKNKAFLTFFSSLCLWVFVGCNPSKEFEKKGKICLELEDYGRAKSFYSEGIETDPNSFESRYGYALSLSGLLSEKQKWTTTSVEDWLEVTNAYRMAYSLYRKLYQKEVEALSFKKYYRSSLYALADLSYRNQKYYSALETLEELDSLGFSYPKSIHLNGVVYYQLGFEEETEQLFRKAISKDSSYSNAYLSLGNLLLGQGREQEAREVLERIRRIHPNDFSLNVRIQKILAKN